MSALYPDQNFPFFCSKYLYIETLTYIIQLCLSTSNSLKCITERGVYSHLKKKKKIENHLNNKTVKTKGLVKYMCLIRLGLSYIKPQFKIDDKSFCMK